jgi:hypothetical protein
MYSILGLLLPRLGIAFTEQLVNSIRWEVKQGEEKMMEYCVKYFQERGWKPGEEEPPTLPEQKEKGEAEAGQQAARDSPGEQGILWCFL